MSLKPIPLDITKKYGRLTAIKLDHTEKNKSNKHYIEYYECICDCGNKHIVSKESLKSGKTQSCGCLKRELARNNAIKNVNNHTKHSLSSTKLCNIWRNIRYRCYNPKCSDYRYFGARGITICKEWKTDFQAFYDWSIANGYKEGYSIKRIDKKGNHEPSNCVWVNNNKKTTA